VVGVVNLVGDCAVRHSGRLACLQKEAEAILVTTFNRICIEDWEATAENGDHFKVERGKEYLTSSAKGGRVIVFSYFWVSAPVGIFSGERRFT